MNTHLVGIIRPSSDLFLQATSTSKYRNDYLKPYLLLENLQAQPYKNFGQLSSTMPLTQFRQNYTAYIFYPDCCSCMQKLKSRWRPHKRDTNNTSICRYAFYQPYHQAIKYIFIDCERWELRPSEWQLNHDWNYCWRPSVHFELLPSLPTWSWSTSMVYQTYYQWHAILDPLQKKALLVDHSISKAQSENAPLHLTTEAAKLRHMQRQNMPCLRKRLQITPIFTSSTIWTIKSTHKMVSVI